VRLSDEYAFADAYGKPSALGKHFEAKYGKAFKPCDAGFYTYWKGGPDTMFAGWP
jgi:hypothetical protein